MAAILGSVGTARADDSTIIASKGYVDAYAQKQSDRVESTWAASTADHTSTTKYPSMNTLNDAITNVTTNLTITDGSQTGTGVVKTVTQTNGTVSATAGTVDTAEITDGAVTYAKVAAAAKQTAQDLSAPGATLTRWDASTAADNVFPTVKAVAQQIGSVDVSAAVQDGTNALTLTDSATTAPSVTAVKGITDNTTTAYTTRDASTHVLTGSGSSTKVPTTAAVVTALKDLDMTELNGNDLQGHEYDYGKPVVQLSQVDGKVYGALGQVGTAGIMDGAVGTTQIANGAVTAAKVGSKEIAADAIDSTTSQVVKWGTSNNPGTAGYADDAKFPTVAAVAQQIAASAVAPNPNGPITASTDHSIVTYNADGLVTGGISLPGLNDINDATTDAACTKGAPCVLSYYVDSGTKYYKWTNMDTEGLNAVNDSSNS